MRSITSKCQSPSCNMCALTRMPFTAITATNSIQSHTCGQNPFPEQATGAKVRAANSIKITLLCLCFGDSLTYALRMPNSESLIKLRRTFVVRWDVSTCSALRSIRSRNASNTNLITVNRLGFYVSGYDNGARARMCIARVEQSENPFDSARRQLQ